MFNKSTIYFARVLFRNDDRLVGISQLDRMMHMHIIGKTGTGKSTMLKTMMQQDIANGNGFCLLDPHGDLCESIRKIALSKRSSDLINFDLTKRNLQYKYNPLKKVPFEARSLVTSGILEVFEKLWTNAWGVKLEHILRFTLITLLDQEEANLAHIPELLLNKKYRMTAVRTVKNPSVRAFWLREFPQYNRYDLLPVLNKIGGMLVHPVIRRVLIENTEEISLRKAMDEKKIILMNLNKGIIGADVTKIIGSLFVTSLSSASFSRANIDEKTRVPFNIYMDEFHNFSTLSLVEMFSELRKYSVSMTIAHQYFHQLDEKIKRAILGNVGTLVSFRVGAEDAIYLEKEMEPKVLKQDLVNLPNFHIYTKLMINGACGKAFSATTFYSQV